MSWEGSRAAERVRANLEKDALLANAVGADNDEWRRVGQGEGGGDLGGDVLNTLLLGGERVALVAVGRVKEKLGAEAEALKVRVVLEGLMEAHIAGVDEGAPIREAEKQLHSAGAVICVNKNHLNAIKEGGLVHWQRAEHSPRHAGLDVHNLCGELGAVDRAIAERLRQPSEMVRVCMRHEVPQLRAGTAALLWPAFEVVHLEPCSRYARDRLLLRPRHAGEPRCYRCSAGAPRGCRPLCYLSLSCRNLTFLDGQSALRVSVSESRPLVVFTASPMSRRFSSHRLPNAHVTAQHVTPQLQANRLRCLAGSVAGSY